jgi:hypothetical protein
MLSKDPLQSSCKQAPFDDTVCCVIVTNSEQNLLTEHDQEEVCVTNCARKMCWQPKFRSHLTEMCSQYVLTLQWPNGARTHTFIKTCTQNCKDDHEHWKCNYSEQKSYSAEALFPTSILLTECWVAVGFLNAYGHRVPMAIQSPED